MATLTVTPITAGDIWICTREGAGKGQNVRIMRAGANNVQFRNHGSGDRSQSFHLPTDIFRVQYKPLKLYSEATRIGSTDTKPDFSWAAEPPKKEEKQVKEDPATFEVRAAGHRVDWPAAEEQKGEEQKKLPGFMTPPSLSDETAREIWQQIAAGQRQVDVAEAYNLSTGMVNQIWSGSSYRKATHLLWPTSPLWMERYSERMKGNAWFVKAMQETGNVMIPTMPVTPTPNMEAMTPSERAAVYRERAQAAKDAEQDTPPLGQPPLLPTRVEEVKEALPTAVIPDVTDLVKQMADALEIMLQFQGRPLPKYISTDGIASIISEARSLFR